MQPEDFRKKPVKVLLVGRDVFGRAVSCCKALDRLEDFDTESTVKQLLLMGALSFESYWAKVDDVEDKDFRIDMNVIREYFGERIASYATK